ncbi:hypothetical protein EPICR_10161 [Candidatus Desulfarcum epimagneticum]|uniref:Uncharacterized protein n=1 Tax=uncultured Desulfobacteraceae bacterium TaxID=218296 RepID=A0A484HBV5_9BACT|nr:hypothetical protein EPICR_10161 [uncultured Desulfobacteraceae bacterium]
MKTNSLIKLFVFFPLVFFCGCLTYAPLSLRVLPDEPMAKTGISYLPMKNLFRSDDKMVIVPHWGAISKPGEYDLKIEISGPAGTVLYTKEIKNAPVRSHHFYWHTIPINDEVRAMLTHGDAYTVNFYMNNELSLSRKGRYIDESLINEKVKNAVILPFEIQQEKAFFNPGELSNMFAHPIFFEVKRIIPDTVPAHISKGKLVTGVKISSFKKKEALEKIKEMFPRDVIIAGKVELGERISDMNRLIVLVYHAQTGKIKRFEAKSSGAKRKFRVVFEDLVESLFRDQNLAGYIREMG